MEGYFMLAKELKKLRDEKGYSLQTVANMTGLSGSYINRLESGERRKPSVDIIKKLAEAYEVEFLKLVEFAGREEEGTVVETSDEIISLKDLISNHDFEINGKVATKEMKESILRTLDIVFSTDSIKNEGFKKGLHALLFLSDIA
jgi:transcriptional regulator with XRE-family HTH domain